MKAYYIDRSAEISVRNGDEGFWFDDEEITWSEIETPEFPDHALYYDDNAIFHPGEVRVIVGGVEVPLPVFFAKVDGEDIREPEITTEDLMKTLKLPDRQ